MPEVLCAGRGKVIPVTVLGHGSSLIRSSGSRTGPPARRAGRGRSWQGKRCPGAAPSRRRTTRDRWGRPRTAGCRARAPTRTRPDAQQRPGEDRPQGLAHHQGEVAPTMWSYSLNAKGNLDGRGRRRRRRSVRNARWSARLARGQRLHAPLSGSQPGLTATPGRRGADAQRAGARDRPGARLEQQLEAGHAVGQRPRGNRQIPG